MNDFATELKELIDKWLVLGTTEDDIADALLAEIDKIVEIDDE